MAFGQSNRGKPASTAAAHVRTTKTARQSDFVPHGRAASVATVARDARADDAGGRTFGWWSVRKKCAEIPRIRAALGMAEKEANEGENEGDEQKRNPLDGNADQEDEASEMIRIVHGACNTLSLERVEHIRKPTSRRIMTWIKASTGDLFGSPTIK